MIEYKIFTNAVHKIALKRPRLGDYRFFRRGKTPHISFDTNPSDYRGLNDGNYGTGFETTYIKALDRFFCVIDIDDYKTTDFNISEAIPEELNNTHSTITQSNGKHIYLLSKEPLELKQNPNVPIDLKAIRKPSFQAGKHGGLIVGNFSWKQRWDEFGEPHYFKAYYKHNNKDILEVDINNIVDRIYNNLGLESEEIHEYKDFPVVPVCFEADQDKIENLYNIIKMLLNKNMHNKHNTLFYINCETRSLGDNIRLQLWNWILRDYGQYFEDIDNARNEFLKR